MKSTSLMIMVAFSLTIITFISCKDHRQDEHGCNRKDTVSCNIHSFPAPEPPFSSFIPVDSANRMISSYLQSINYEHNDTDLRSLIFNVDSLEKYLHYARFKKIKNIKLMFAHSMEYINAGNYGTPAGYRSGALTLILAGYDDSSNYIVMPGNAVMEHSMPCPTNCPVDGTAANNLIILKR